MNTDERKRLRELSDKATPGPWEHSPTDLWACITQSEFVLLKHEGTDRSVVLADAAFIAAARVAVLEEVRKAAEKITSAMEYQSFEDWSETEEYDALKSALDLAGEK